MGSLRGNSNVALRLWSVLALVAACGALALVGTGGAAGAVTPVCKTANLRLDKIGENDFTSHRGWIFALRNVGSTTCKLRGFPKARLLGAGAQALPTVVSHLSGSVHTLVLKPWKRAKFGFVFAVSGPCPAAVFAYGVRFAPPGNSSGLVFYAGKFDLCGPAPAHVGVQPLS